MGTHRRHRNEYNSPSLIPFIITYYYCNLIKEGRTKKGKRASGEGKFRKENTTTYIVAATINIVSYGSNFCFVLKLFDRIGCLLDGMFLYHSINLLQ
jgi:hypothetical protein